MESIDFLNLKAFIEMVHSTQVKMKVYILLETISRDVAASPEGPITFSGLFSKYGCKKYLFAFSSTY